MNKQKHGKGFQMTFPNGAILQFTSPIFNPHQKSYDLMINNGKDNCFYKVGIIKDIDKIRKMVFEEAENE